MQPKRSPYQTDITPDLAFQEVPKVSSKYPTPAAFIKSEQFLVGPTNSNAYHATDTISITANNEGYNSDVYGVYNDVHHEVAQPILPSVTSLVAETSVGNKFRKIIQFQPSNLPSTPKTPPYGGTFNGGLLAYKVSNCNG